MPHTSTELRRGVLIDAGTLHEMLSTGRRVVVLDVRWSLAVPDGRRLYAAGHVPGAQFVDLDRDLAGPPSAPDGRHPLPAIEDLQECARRWGIDDGDLVVVYDDDGGTSAARAWWLLRWGGLERVRILDGGLHAWSAVGGILEDGEVSVSRGHVTLTAGGMPTTDADGAASYPERGVLIDARSRERYAGEVEPVDARAGHIPGAVNLPTTETIGVQGRVRPESELKERFERIGVSASGDVAVYCGSGVTAAHEVAVLATLGVPATLYPGSWSQWSADSERPVATGPEPLGGTAAPEA